MGHGPGTRHSPTSISLTRGTLLACRGHLLRVSNLLPSVSSRGSVGNYFIHADVRNYNDSASAMRLFQTMNMKPKPKPKKRMPPPHSGTAAAAVGLGAGGRGAETKKQPSLVVKPDIGGDAYSSSSDGGRKASTRSVAAERLAICQDRRRENLLHSHQDSRDIVDPAAWL